MSTFNSAPIVDIGQIVLHGSAYFMGVPPSVGLFDFAPIRDAHACHKDMVKDLVMQGEQIVPIQVVSDDDIRLGDYVRQGDIYLFKVSRNNLRQPAHIRGHIILGHGEQTGHQHRVLVDTPPSRLGHESVRWLVGAIEDIEARNKAVERFSFTGEGDVFIRSDTAFSIFHEEHAAIQLPPGDYRVVRQREVSPLDKETRYVAD